jgi:hypothetical protein
MKRILLMAVTLMCFVQVSFAYLCPRCRYDNVNNAEFCIQCGQPMSNQPEYFYCPKCNFQNPYGSHFCGGCGDELRYGPPGLPPQDGYGPQQGYGPQEGYGNQGGYGGFDFGGQGNHHGKHHGNHQGNHPKAQHADWRFVTTISGNGEKTAQELPGGGAMRKFMLKGASGSMIIHTFVIREGGAAEHFPITTRFSPGQEVVKDLPREYNSTGFRVSKEGKGSVEVYVQ